tara:strand:+ start:801 stop:1055 length:255 start_codon:yes stop_codon:yes gene_type:complete
MVEYYTTLEKVKEMVLIKKQIHVYGLSNHQNIKKFDEIVQNYIKKDEEFTGKIKLHGTSRTMVIKFRNNKKWPINCHLLFDKNV